MWYAASARHAVLIPTIGRVVEVLAHPFREPPNVDTASLAHSVAVSLLRVVLGFGAALATAVPLGVLVGCNRTARHVCGPIIELARPISPVAWMPLAVLLLGFSSLGNLLYGDQAWRHSLLDQVYLAIVAVVWWAAFFPVFLNTVHGVTHVRRLHIEAARACGAGRRQILAWVILPAALPVILVGVRLGFGRALMVIVAAEFFPGTRAGLGYLITSASQVAQYQYVFACVVVTACVGLVVNTGLQALENRVGRWGAKER